MNKIFKAIIVDDEKLAREDIKAIAKGFEEIEIIGEASNNIEAKKLIDNLNPDLIFLDIQMPGRTGFELLTEIQTDAKIIFVTAYDEYAIRAFEVNAQDYLLKPVNKERLALAIEHLKLEGEIQNTPFKKLEYNDNVFLMVNNTYQFIKVSSIIVITSAGNYSEILTNTKLKGLVLKSMKEWESRLPNNFFIRIHRNAIINLEFLERTEDWFSYSYQVFLKGLEKPFVMSRRYASKLKDKMV
ncbi:MAG: LytTR family DNA-binding domain-containing protein [Ignavibacteriales bacterium]|nr:LytTR family DNA-binding domain-containing protein [Ignavibacteriales bacterium]